MRRHAYHLLCLAMSLLLTIKAWAIPPAITSQPNNATACVAATNVKFIIAASNATSYQWQVDDNGGGGFVNISNGGVYAFATTTSLTLNGVTAGMNGYQFRCIATGPDAPPATSNVVTLTVNSPVSISSQPPASLSICSNASISVGTTGTVTGYQWYGNTGSAWVAISNTGYYTGANSATLNITGITPGPGAYTAYYCDVLGPCNTRRSNITYATINTVPSITAQPANKTACVGYTTNFNVTATGTGAAYQWQISYSGGTLWTNIANNATFSGATTSQLNVNVNASLLNTSYRCVVSGTCSPAANSNAATLTVNSQVAITAQPLNKEICEGVFTFFSITASGTVSSYQWQNYTGSGWVNMADGGLYTGTSTRTLNVTGATVVSNGSLYRCIVTDGACPSGTKVSSVCTLTVKAKTLITAQPVNVAPICSGGNASYSVSAVGDNITYQWHIYDGTQFVPLTNTGVYSGANSATLNITGITASPSAQSHIYRCVVTGSCNTATSNPTTLTVNALPTITSQPADVAICNSYAATFNTTATGTNLSYQWQVSYSNGTLWTNVVNNGTFSGVTTNQLLVSNAATSLNNSMYRCNITGACAPVATTAAAKLTVNTAINISGQPVNRDICEGNYTFFHIGTTGTVSSYQWQQFTTSGWTNMTNGGIYSGVNTATLTLTGANSTYNNTYYRCIVADGACPGGTKVSNVCTLTVKSTVITANPPASVTVCGGTNTSLSVAASGNINSYQWYGNSGTGWVAIANTGYYSGATTATLNITGIMPGAGAYTAYYCVVNGPCVQRKSATTYMTINAPAVITMQPSNKTVCDGFATSFQATTTGSGLTYQWQIANPMDSTGWSNLANDSVYSSTNSSQLVISKTSASLNGKTYRCIISGGCAGNIMTNVVMLTVNTKPVITMHPGNVNACGTNMASFSTMATGSGLVYQWQKLSGSTWVNVMNDTINYSGANTATLHISGITMAMSNTYYRCYVSGSCTPALYTNSASLKVSGANIVSDPSSHSIPATTNTTFSVTATGNGVMYQWQSNTGSGWSSLSNSGNYSGTTTAMMGISNVPLSFNGYQYRCIVSDSCSADTSMAATLTVTPPDTTIPSLTNYTSNSNRSNETINRFNVSGSSQNADGSGLTISGLKLYPNPNNGSFNVTGRYSANTENAKITIVNSLGQIIYTATSTIESGLLYHKIDMDGRLAPGVYIIRIDVNNAPAMMQFNVSR